MLKKKRIHILLMLVLCMLFAVNVPLGAQLTDISGHWAESQLRTFIDQGLAQGYPDGTFKPDGSISRAEFVTLVNHAMKYNIQAGISFSDVSAKDWFSQEVSIARAAGYISGYEDGSFRPNQAISRQEAASILARIAGLDTGTVNISRFKDAGTIPQWSQGAISAVAAKGYMHGYPDASFQPVKKISRAEAIVTLSNYLNTLAPAVEPARVYDKAGIYGPVSGAETIDGDVVISASGVTLQNCTITGSLTLAEGIGNGDVSLKDVKVGGKTFVKGGGSNSIAVEDCDLPILIIDKDGVHIIVSGSTTVAQVQIHTAATLSEMNISGTGFESAALSGSISADSIITLEGNFKNIIVQSPNIQIIFKSGRVDLLTIADTAEDTNIYVAEAASVNTVELYSPVNITGSGKLTTVKVYAAGANIQQIPENIVNPEGLTINTGVVAGAVNPDQAVVVSDVELTNTFGAFKFATNVVTNADTILLKVKVNGAALKSVEKRSQGVDGTAWKGYINNPQYETNYVITCESPFTLTGTNTIRWDSSIPAPAVTGLSAEDVGSSGDGSDLRVSFNGADGETQKIASYRIMVVRSAGASTFTLSSANAVSAANYTTVAKTGAATYSLTLDDARDTEGSLLTDGVAYKVFVLSVADGTNATVNSLSAASNEITLDTPPGGGATPTAPTFVSAEVTNTGDVSITFSKTMEGTTALAGKEGQFTVSVDGNPDIVTGLSLTATTTKIKLTLTTKISSGQTVTVAYAKSADNALQVKAADGGILDTFAAQPVTNGLVPAAPAFVSAEVTNTGDVSITFSKTMEGTTALAGKEGQFTVSVDGNPDIVTGLSLTSTTNKIKLTLTTKASSGQTVTVAYAKSADTALQVKAADGGVLDTFSTQPVTNSLVPAAPAFVSAEVTNTGDVSITFSKTMEGTTALAGKEGQFTVSVDGNPDVVTGLSLTSTTSKIKLTLTTKVSSGQTVTVAYAKSTDAALQVKDADGLVLETFTAQPVSNGLLPPAPTYSGAEVTTKGDVSIYFSKAMADPTGKEAQFTVTVDGVDNDVTAVESTSTSNKIKLVLENDILTAGHTIVIQYVKGADDASQVKSSDGGVLESFSQTITN